MTGSWAMIGEKAYHRLMCSLFGWHKWKHEQTDFGPELQCVWCDCCIDLAPRNSVERDYQRRADFGD